MKNLTWTFCLLCCLAISACSSNQDEKSADSSATQQDTGNMEDTVTATDTTTVPAKGASSSAAIGGFDTSRAKLDTANTNPKK